ncbi:hypothetical protein C0992_000576 [Termitomyces sp. T32_za158]|nr:hypothetical protein C0992_000576 [Termitomyces sp. T32_za158]
MEGVPSNSLGGVPSYEFNGLNNPSKSKIRTNYLMLDTRILSLGVLANEDSVYIVIRSFETLNGHTRSDIGKEIEGSS